MKNIDSPQTAFSQYLEDPGSKSETLFVRTWTIITFALKNPIKTNDSRKMLPNVVL